jgi:hypothetical protein
VLHQALSLAGLEFTDDQEQMMLAGINRDLAQYRRSRVRQGHRSGAAAEGQARDVARSQLYLRG